MTDQEFQHRQAMWALLEARIAFRKRWAMQFAYVKPTVSAEAIAWEYAYDEENNFARMGAEFVDSAWGVVPPKPPAPRRARTLMAAIRVSRPVTRTPSIMALQQ